MEGIDLFCFCFVSVPSFGSYYLFIMLLCYTRDGEVSGLFDIFMPFSSLGTEGFFSPIFSVF